MCPVAYFTMVRSKKPVFDLRIHMVRFALEQSIRAAAGQFLCSRNTVRKWVRRYQSEGLIGLEDRSRAPKSCPHKTPAALEADVIRQRRRTPGFGARRMKREFELKPSVGAIARIIRQKGLTRPRKRKRLVKRDLRAVKARYAPLSRFQMDVKYLNDIPNYWPYMTGMGLPKFQYTARCVKTGATFLAYGSELSLTYAELTARRLLTHLSRHGIDPSDVVVQTDRGSEFDGQTVNKTGRGFTHTIERVFGAHHRLLVKANPNANADVESFHAHEEPEFFDIESFRHQRDFWEKITTYQNYWNLGRPNSYKGDRTPLDILRESSPKIPPEALLLEPADLDNLLAAEVGHHVPVLTGADFLGEKYPRHRYPLPVQP